VGDISSLTGYKQAYVIKNGRTVLGDGGGVCQVSTTLFRAALNTGLPILERTSHAYRVQYYENDAKPGLDATVFGPTVDLKIQNDTPAAILIETEIDKENNILTFKLFGKKDGRTVELSPVRVYDEQPPPAPRYEDDPTLKKGVTKQVDFASWGAKSQYTYKIHKADKSTYERTFNSVYRPWQAVYLVGQAD
jgi:vancomycin resistance protein YoaR